MTTNSLDGTLDPATPTTPAATLSATFRKITLRFLPLLFLCYLVAYLDRVNVSFAKLQMLNDLHLSEAVYGLGAGVFFIGYFLFEVPSNMALHKVGARRWIARIMITWGILSAAMAYVESSTGFYVLRFLLGVAEAGFYPGILLYLTQWFPSSRRGHATALFVAGNPASGIIGGPLSGYIMATTGGALGLSAWQWLFMIEALPAILLGIVVFFYLDDSIAKAKWLSTEEKTLLNDALAEDAKNKTLTSFASVWRSPRVWLMCLIYFGICLGSNTFQFWQPTIIKGYGIDNPMFIGLLSSLPYMVALISMQFVGRSADRRRERRWHVAVPLLVGAVGFTLCVLFKANIILAMLGLCMAAGGVITAIAHFWGLPTSFLGGGAAALGIAIINCTGNLGNFVSPVIMGWLISTTGSMTAGLFLSSGWLIITAFVLIKFVPAKVVNH